MTGSLPRMGLATTLLVMASAQAGAYSLDAQALKDYGGTYMLDCRNNASPRATVSANATVFMAGASRVASNSIEPGYSFFHPNPSPKGFRASLINTGPGGQEMLWHVFQDAAGQYLVYEHGDQRSEAVIKAAVGSRKLRRCDGGAGGSAGAGSADAPVPKAAAVPPAVLLPRTTGPRSSAALHEMGASGILLDRKARAAYFKALGPLRREPWLATLDGPSPQNRWVTIAGTQYLFASACKNHDCADFNTVLLYSEQQAALVGAVYRAGQTTLIGAPTPAIAKELGRLWRQEFRRGS